MDKKRRIISGAFLIYFVLTKHNKETRAFSIQGLGVKGFLPPQSLKHLICDPYKKLGRFWTRG